MEINIKHDGKIHHPLGGASYVFNERLIPFILSKFNKNCIKISIGAQPNSSPHFGTIVVFMLAFALGERIKKEGRNVLVFFEVVDTGPAEKMIIDGVTYQKSLRRKNFIDKFMPSYHFLLNFLSIKTDIKYEIRYQDGFNSHDDLPGLLKKLVERKAQIGPILDPKYGNLRIRAACPKCGLTDKNAVDNRYSEKGVTFFCPKHGEFSYTYEESEVFEYNTPLRNLIRAILYGYDNTDRGKDYEWLRVTGSDYAGFYQEELLYRAATLLDYNVNNLPSILYAPLITDWSGAKLSKSLYVNQGAYNYLPQYLVDLESFLRTFNEEGLEILYNEVIEWINEPYKLFRCYSIYYFIQLFDKHE